MTVFRCFVEKKAPFAVEAASVKNDLEIVVKGNRIQKVRILNRYDIENLSEENYFLEG